MQQRRAFHRLAAFVVVVPLLLMSQHAASQSTKPPEVPRTSPLATRVAELERRVAELEARLAMLERIQLKALADGAYALTVNEVTFVIGRDGRVTLARHPASSAGASATAPSCDCDPPYVILQNGIRTLKPECLSPDCSSAADESCDPPYLVDPTGIRRIKPSCL